MYSRDQARLRASTPAEGGPSSRANTNRPELRPRFVTQVVLLIGAGAVAVAVAESAAAAGWSIERAPQPARSDDSELLGVSCTSRSDCVAVGRSIVPSTGNPIPVVEHWNGATWSIQRTPIPTASGWGGVLSAVSCTESTASPLAPSKPTAQTVRLPSDGTPHRGRSSARPNRSTPTSSTTCRASRAPRASPSATANSHGPSVGMARAGRSRTFISAIRKKGERVDGRVLHLQGTCAAVGTDDIGLCGYDYSDYLVPVLGFWKSGRWSLRRRPNLGCSDTPRGDNDLDAVSCTSTTSCTAVGSVVYRWDGHDWSTQSAPNGGDHSSEYRRVT